MRCCLEWFWDLFDLFNYYVRGYNRIDDAASISTYRRIPKRRLQYYDTMPFGLPKPSVFHAVVTDLKERIIIVGDIHGCFEELQELLIKCQYDKNHSTLIFVGDLVNKGPFSSEVVKFVREENALCVRGNHDDSALAVALRKKPRKADGEHDYIDNLSREDIEWLQNLPYTITLPTINSIIVHAGFIPTLDIHHQSFLEYNKMRNLIQRENGVFESIEKPKHGVAWASIWPGPEHVYFGHDAKRGLQLERFATGLDTGCCYGRQLTAIILPERTFVHVNAKRAYEDKSKVKY